MNTQTGTIENTDIVNAVRDYITNNNRPCPTDHLTKKFGEIVVEMLPAIKKNGSLVGLRGRNGGLMIPGMEGLVKRKTEPKTVITKKETLPPPPAVIEVPSLADSITAVDDALSPITNDDDFERMTQMMSGNIPMDKEWINTNYPGMIDDESSVVPF